MSEMNDNRIAIGVDPGKDGAMAILGLSDCPVVTPFAEGRYILHLHNIAKFVQDNPKTKVLAAVEHVSAMPGQGVTSCFSFGQNFGWILGVLDSCWIPYELVRPQKWKKEFSCTSDKNTSIAVAKRLFPHVDLRRTERCTKDHDGKAEALLLAEFCRRRMS